MKSILMSDRPEWVAKILNGEKIGEVRKNAPRQWLDYFNGKLRRKPFPIEVLIYCTAPNSEGGVIGRFDSEGNHICYNRKVVAKFTLKEIFICNTKDRRTWEEPWFVETVKDQLAMPIETLHDYVGDNVFYIWYISDLVIFDQPKELSEFRYKKVTMKWDKNYHHRIVKKEIIPVKRAPQSWQYVEVEDKDEI